MTRQNSNPRLRPVIRVFVSSTFGDLRQERNALQEHVYPKLEQFCQKSRFQFQAIDLRWGVSSEAGLDHRTMRICFEELRRSQEVSPEPNFLILLGNRYGWRPLPEEISVKEFEKLEGMAHAESAEHAEVLRSWYRLDANAVVGPLEGERPREPRESRASEVTPDGRPTPKTGVYILQSRRQRLPDGTDYTQDAPWHGIQSVLWDIINRAYPPENLVGRFASDSHALPEVPPIVRFQASATEQEIWCGALSAPNAERHVLAFFRDIANRDEFAPLEVKDFFDLTDEGPFDAAAATNQDALKAAIRRRLGDEATAQIPFSRLTRENGKVVVESSPEDIQTFCDSVETRLRSIIERQIEQYWHGGTQVPAERAVRELEIEQQEHARVAQERGCATTFVGRQFELKAIRDYVCSDSPWPLVIHGASGCGKTALMARAAQEAVSSTPPLGGPASVPAAADTEVRPPDATPVAVFVRFIGTTPRSSDLRGLLTGLCQEMRLRHPREGDLSSDIKLLEVELHEQFKAATPEQPLILFLDALDQLADTDGGRNLHWIPTGSLPAHVKLVVSCLSDRANDPAGQPWIELQRRQLPAGQVINLDAFSEHEARTLLFKRWLPQAGRTVSADQRARIELRLTSAACRQPIYLKLLFEEARLWRSYDAAPDLGESVPALLDQLFERLSQPTNHGPLLVERVLGYLAASREGLAENEILEILFHDPEYKAALDQATIDTRHEMPPNATRIPVAIWSRLRFDLASYLTERAATGANVLTFYHRQVAEWVQEHFAKAVDQHWQAHPLLADYFDNLEHGPRRTMEFPWQLERIGDWHRLKQALSEIPLVELSFRQDHTEVVRYWSEVVRHLKCSIWEAYRFQWESALADGQDLSALPTILGNLGYAAEAELIVGASVRKLREQGDAHGTLAAALVGYSQFFMARNSHAEARRLLEEALGLFRMASRDICEANTLSDLAGLSGPIEALRMLDEAERIYERHGLRGHVATCMANRANVCMATGALEDAVRLQKAALETFRELRNPIEIAEHELGLAALLKHQQVYEEALTLVTVAEKTFRQFGLHGALGHCLGEKGNVLGLLGRGQEALAANEEAESFLRTSGQEIWLTSCVYNQAILAYQLGLTDRARTKCDKALDLMRECSAPVGMVRSCQTLKAQIVGQGQDHAKPWYVREAKKRTGCLSVFIVAVLVILLCRL